MSRDFRRQGKMSSRFLNATGAAAIAVMLASSVQTASAQISFPWERSPQGAPQGQAQSDDADAEMRIQRLENQLRQLTGQNEELQYRNRQLEERLRQLGAAPPAPGGQPPVAQPGWRQRRPRFSPIHRTASRSKAIRSKAIRKPSPVMASSRRSPRPPRSCRTRQPRRRAAAAAAMRSIPARTPTPPVRRARSAAVRCRSQTKPRSVHRAVAVPVNRSISAPPARVIPVAPCRHRCGRRPAAARSRQRRADHACRPRPRPRTSSTSASATCSARTTRWPKRR